MYYKTLTQDMRAPNKKSFSYEGWEDKTFKVEGELVPCENGLHLYKSLSHLTVGNFGPRIFEALPIGEFIDDGEKIVCREIRLLRELGIDEICVEGLESAWAYRYCLNIKDIPEMRDKIIESEWAYYYCLRVKDRKEMRDKIVE